MRNAESREIRTGWLFLAPALLAVALFVLVPVLGTAWTSLFRDVSYLPRRFVGPGNYLELLRQPGFAEALGFTLRFAAVTVLLEGLLALPVALLLHEPFRGRGMLRVLVLLPWIIPTIVSARLWKLVFDYSHGALNAILPALGLVPGPVNWLGTPATAFWALVAAEVWKTTPFVVILLLAGLQAIPDELYRQARIDGSRRWARFVRVTLPLLRPALIVALVFRTIDALRVFDLVFVLTGGGPGGATRSLSYLGYEHFVQDRFGLGSAVSLVAFLVAMLFTLFYLRAGRFRDLLHGAAE